MWYIVYRSKQAWLQAELQIATMEKARAATAMGSSLLTAPTAIKRGCIRWPVGMSAAVVADCTVCYCQGRTSDYLDLWR
jgi:hypothetical protein